MSTEPLNADAGFEVRALRELGPERERCEDELLRGGGALPLVHRMPWARMRQQAVGAGSWFFDVVDRTGVARGGFAAEVIASRALPGYQLLRVERFGMGVPPDALAAALGALAQLVRADRRIVRLSVELFAPRPELRDTIRATLGGLGFVEVEARHYARTLLLDLMPDESTIFAGLKPTARRQIRQTCKHPVEIRRITDVAWAGRMAELVSETLRRTGGDHRQVEWSERIALANAHPNLMLPIGLFRTDRAGPASLLAFALSCFNGQDAHYELGGSTRTTDLKLPLNRALMWESICWAKRNGAAWFDFGGITAGHHGDGHDTLGGISDFKRMFTDHVVDVGGEWMLEPHAFTARLAQAISRAAALATRFAPAALLRRL